MTEHELLSWVHDELRALRRRVDHLTIGFVIVGLGVGAPELVKLFLP